MTGDVDANSVSGNQQGETTATCNITTGSHNSLPHRSGVNSTQMQPLQQEGQANEVITTTRDSTPTTDISTIVPITGTAVGETAAAAMAQEQQPQLHQGQTLPASASGVHPTETGTAATGTRATSAEVHSTAVARAEAATVAAAAGMRTENVVGVNQAPGQEAASSRVTSTPQVAGAKVNPSHQAVGLRPDATRQLVATRPSPQQPVRTSPPQQMAGYQHQPHHGLPNTFQPSDLGGAAQLVPQYAPAHMLAAGQPRYAALPSTAGAPPNAPGQRQFQSSPDQAVGVPGGHRDASPSAASVPYAIEARAAAAAAAYRSQNPIESAKYQMLLPNDITTAAAAAAAARRQSESAELSHWPIVEEDPLPIYFRATDGIGTACADGLRRKRKEEWQAAVAIPIPPRMVGSLREHEVQSNKACACKNSACLKLYCECFASGFLCTSACACDNQPGTEKQCRNNHENLSVRHLSIIQAIQRNPHHFSQNMNPISLGSPQSSPTARSQAVPASRKPVHVPDEKKRTCNCSKSKCLKMYCECFSAGVTCSKSCKCTGCENIPGNKALASTLARKRKKVANLSSSVPSLAASGVAQGKSGATSKGPATAASATTAASAPKPPTATKPSPRARPALLQGGRPIHGIAFFSADLRGVSSSQQQKKKPAEAPKPSRLHHNLMLAPSALLTGSDGTASSRTAVKGLMMTAFANTKGSGLFGSRPSELEEAWDKETTKVTTFFAQMRRQLDAKSQGSSRTRDQHHQAQYASSAYGTSASNPAILLKALQEDVKALHNVAQTAQIEAHVSLRDESRRDARWWQGKRAAVVAKLDGKDRKRAGDELWCDEDFDEAVETAPKVSTGEETMNVQRLRDLVVRAAVDTALLRETARIVRSKARELARKRMKTSVETKR